MLQETGHATVGAGNAIAVQNFFENTAMLLMVGLYTVLTHAGISPVAAATVFGAVVLCGIGILAIGRRHA